MRTRDLTGIILEDVRVRALQNTRKASFDSSELPAMPAGSFWSGDQPPEPTINREEDGDFIPTEGD